MRRPKPPHSLIPLIPRARGPRPPDPARARGAGRYAGAELGGRPQSSGRRANIVKVFAMECDCWATITNIGLDVRRFPLEQEKVDSKRDGKCPQKTETANLFGCHGGSLCGYEAADAIAARSRSNRRQGRPFSFRQGRARWINFRRGCELAVSPLSRHQAFIMTNPLGLP
jgi:hypothetical protein